MKLRLHPHETALEFNKSWYNHLNSLGPLELLKIFASNEYENMSRELAIMRLNHLLSDPISKKMLIDISVMIQLKPLLYSCLLDQRISYHLFIFLGEVVNHVAYEVLIILKEEWRDLWQYYIAKPNRVRENCLYLPMLDDAS